MPEAPRSGSMGSRKSSSKVAATDHPGPSRLSADDVYGWGVADHSLAPAPSSFACVDPDCLTFKTAWPTLIIQKGCLCWVCGICKANDDRSLPSRRARWGALHRCSMVGVHKCRSVDDGTFTDTRGEDAFQVAGVEVAPEPTIVPVQLAGIVANVHCDGMRPTVVWCIKKSRLLDDVRRTVGTPEVVVYDALVTGQNVHRTDCVHQVRHTRRVCGVYVARTRCVRGVRGAYVARTSRPSDPPKSTSMVHITKNRTDGGSIMRHVVVLRNGVISPILPEGGVASSPRVAPGVRTRQVPHSHSMCTSLCTLPPPVRFLVKGDLLSSRHIHAKCPVPIG